MLGFMCNLFEDFSYIATLSSCHFTQSISFIGNIIFGMGTLCDFTLVRKILDRLSDRIFLKQHVDCGSKQMKTLFLICSQYVIQ